ncbi:MAG: ketopantoate reductase family protein [Myxococcota bacterium]|nr:ketopantoate reductase family protein [Myxococcota bacterium]
MRVVVQGAGAVGLGLASALLAGGARVAVVARPAAVEALRRTGLRRTGVLGAHEHAPEHFEAAASLADLATPPADAALVATKSFDVEEAARELAAHPGALGADAPVVLCQNGWGHAERVAPILGEARVFCARVITGFRHPEPGLVDVTVHAEPVRIGSLFGEPAARVAPLCAAVARGGIPCEPSEDVAADLLAKLLYNATLNPLGAILGVSYGALAEEEEGRELLATVARETFAAIRAAGLQTHWPSADAWLEDFFARLLPPTAAHESSMLQDLRAGRRTEIDAITGAVVGLAEEGGVAVPVSRALLAMVRTLEARRRAGRAAPRAHADLARLASDGGRRHPSDTDR